MTDQHEADRLPGAAQQPEVEFLLTADYAEAVSGKVYVMGGGWDRRGVVDFARPQPIAVVVAVLIPWNDTNRSIPLSISLLDVDGAVIIPPLQTQLKAGRPANATPGQKLRFMLAVNLHVMLPRPGEYLIEAQVDDGAVKRVSFFADPVQSLGPVTLA